MVAWIAGVRSRRRFNISTVLFHLVGVSVRRLRSCFFSSCWKRALWFAFSVPVACGLRWKKFEMALHLTRILCTSGIFRPAMTDRCKLCPKHGFLGHLRRSWKALTSFAALSVTACMLGSLHIFLTFKSDSLIASELWEPSNFEVDSTLLLSCHLSVM